MLPQLTLTCIHTTAGGLETFTHTLLPLHSSISISCHEQRCIAAPLLCIASLLFPLHIHTHTPKSHEKRLIGLDIKSETIRSDRSFSSFLLRSLPSFDSFSFFLTFLVLHVKLDTPLPRLFLPYRQTYSAFLFLYLCFFFLLAVSFIHSIVIQRGFSLILHVC